MRGVLFVAIQIYGLMIARTSPFDTHCRNLTSSAAVVLSLLALLRSRPYRLRNDFAVRMFADGEETKIFDVFGAVFYSVV